MTHSNQLSIMIKLGVRKTFIVSPILLKLEKNSVIRTMTHDLFAVPGVANFLVRFLSVLQQACISALSRASGL